MNTTWPEFLAKVKGQSQFHEDYMKTETGWLCIWPDCDCELKCDDAGQPSRISCTKSCGPSDFTATGKCGKNGCVEKPRYRLSLRYTDLGVYVWCSPVNESAGSREFIFSPVTKLWYDNGIHGD